MIVLLTDYGYQGPYVGQLKAIIQQLAPTAPVIDLMHDLPAFNIEAAASLIPAITKNFPDNTIFICVVDPGVGSARKSVLLKADSQYYIGPDNGIFSCLNSTSADIKIWEIIWRPKNLSNSFHGRDLFVPIACHLFNKTINFETDLKCRQKIISDKKYIKPQIIYFDGFGNAVTSIQSKLITENAQLKVEDIIISYARVFSDIHEGKSFWYTNSMELVEIACNKTSAKQSLKLNLGQDIEIV
jgi:S-adenosylmethionine hydrolase